MYSLTVVTPPFDDHDEMRSHFKLIALVALFGVAQYVPTTSAGVIRARQGKLFFFLSLSFFSFLLFLNFKFLNFFLARICN